MLDKAESEAIRSSSEANGWIVVALRKMCRWFVVAHQTVHFRSIQIPVRVRPESTEPIDTLLEQPRRFGYRTVAGMSSTTPSKEPRIFPSMGGQVRKHEIERRPLHVTWCRPLRSRRRRTSDSSGVSIEYGEAGTAGWLWRGSSSATAWSTLAIGYPRAERPATAALERRWRPQLGTLGGAPGRPLNPSTQPITPGRSRRELHQTTKCFPTDLPAMD